MTSTVEVEDVEEGAEVEEAVAVTVYHLTPSPRTRMTDKHSVEEEDEEEEKADTTKIKVTAPPKIEAEEEAEVDTMIIKAQVQTEVEVGAEVDFMTVSSTMNLRHKEEKVEVKDKRENFSKRVDGKEWKRIRKQTNY